MTEGVHNHEVIAMFLPKLLVLLSQLLDFATHLGWVTMNVRQIADEMVHGNHIFKRVSAHLFEVIENATQK